jgi:chitinase
VSPLIFQSLIYSLLHSWEYPAKQGIGCNVISASDSANFLSFLQALRKKAPKLILSAAVSLKPFIGSDGNPMSSVSEFAKVLDSIGSLFLAFSFSHLFSDSVVQRS